MESSPKHACTPQGHHTVSARAPCSRAAWYALRLLLLMCPSTSLEARGAPFDTVQNLAACAPNWPIGSKKEKKGSFTRKKAQKNTRSARASRGALREPSRQGAALGPGVFSRGFADFWRFACTGSAGVHSSLNHVTDLPDAVLKWTLCTQKVRWKKKNFSRKASIRRKHPDFSFKVPP